MTADTLRVPVRIHQALQLRNRHQRKATWDEQDAPEGRWRSYGYEELTARDKTSLDVFWLKDKSLVDLDNRPEQAPYTTPPTNCSIRTGAWSRT